MSERTRFKSSSRSIRANSHARQELSLRRSFGMSQVPDEEEVSQVPAGESRGLPRSFVANFWILGMEIGGVCGGFFREVNIISS